MRLRKLVGESHRVRKFRIITAIHYNRERVYIRHVFTHSEYDRWSGEMRSKKRRKRGK
jgi:mRNA-degrading endonuclease HigB of HigAB toxin-antitoxin module